MQAKRLFFTITILFSLLLSSLSQARNVSIPDANLAAAIRQEIGNTITTDTLLNLTRLEAPNRGITNLAGLEHAHHLVRLNLGAEDVNDQTVNSNAVSDLSPLSGLTELKMLTLSDNNISDVSPLTTLVRLNSLGLADNNISDISALVRLPQLAVLMLWDNPLSPASIDTHILALQAKGVEVQFDPAYDPEPDRPIVRLIYFLPKDRQLQREIDTKMDRLIKDVQEAYAGIMEAHGFGRKTFQFETDRHGNAVVHYIRGKFNDAHYQSPSWGVWDEIEEYFDLSKNIYLAALDISTAIDKHYCGLGASYGGIAGRALIPASGICASVFVTAHELGHAFGLGHDSRRFHSNAKDVDKEVIL